ncbi:MAG: hypothetical protein A2Z25_18965 [Planctomycetes bacterium RBG_16_55_9]|nr:MAG: hypothetical protein A2Z25_18965 [Planctomycetes bacterium RBG_16_55_9]
MVKKVSFSKQHQEISQIEVYYTDITEATREYFEPRTETLSERFLGYTISELNAERDERLEELDRTTSLSILSAIEAAFRIDYLQRCYQKKKDPLSRVFFKIHKLKGSNASFEDDILSAWKENSFGANKVLSDIKGAFKYRHWLAHGRYWEPKLGRIKYDYQSLYQLAQNVFDSFPFHGIDF